MSNDHKHPKKDTHGMHLGHKNELEPRIQETYAAVTALPDVRPRLKTAMTMLIGDTMGIAQAVKAGQMSIDDAIVKIQAMDANLDPHWLDMVVDGK